MKRQKTKLAVLLLALSCVSVGVGASALKSANDSNAAITASAETTYTTHDIGALKLHGNSYGAGGAAGNNAVLYLATESGAAFPILSWDYAFAAASADAFKVNGTAATLNEMKSTGDGMYFSFAALNAGDVVTIGGTYVCESQATKYVIAESKFCWTGSAWEKYVEITYTTHDIGALTFNAMQPDKSNMAYFARLDGVAIPIASTENNANWETAFSYLSGCVKLNGEAISPTIKFPEQLFIEMSTAPSTGDVLKIGGEFYSASLATKYVIAESTFKFNGTAWENYTEINYTEYKATAIGAASSSNASQVYIYPTAGVSAFPNGGNDWESRYAFVANSGEGLKLNGETLSTTDIKLPGTDLFIGLGVEAKEGDILTIDGAYANADKGIKFVFENCALKYNGTTWETYVQTPEVTYTEYKATVINAASSSNASQVYIYPTAGVSAFPNGGNDWESRYAFVANSGEGLKLNGETLSTTDIKLPGTDLFIGLGVEAKEGDILTIDGAYANADKGIKFVFENCALQYDGKAWQMYVTYTTHDIGALKLHVNSTIGSAKDKNNVLYLATESGAAFPILSWDYAFAAASADAFKVNGTAATLNEMKSTGDGMYFSFAALNAGDVVTIGGTYVCESQATKYVIAESKFVWNGTSWEKYVEYTNYEVGGLKIIASSSTTTMVFLYTASEEKMPHDSWDDVFYFRQGSGVGITLNGEALGTRDVKIPGGDMYIGLTVTVQAGDVLKVGGTFYCVDAGKAIIITESEFIYDGTVWANAIDKTKESGKAALDEYKATFIQDNYYEAEWESFDVIVAEGKANIDAAATTADVEAAVANAKAKMDEVVTKAESDAIFDELKVSAKADLEAYKNESEYKAAQWAEIQAIITEANAAIDASESVTAINTAVDSAKAAMDAVKTATQVEADEAAVASAKAELATYKNESEYKAAQWTEIQAIITEANAAIDGAIGNQAAIDEVVANAKAAMDAVKTATQVEADEAAVASAKAELAAYKNESEYQAAQWTEIQAIITQANADIDGAIGNQAAIDEIVANAKADIDDVKTAKEAAKEEIRTYYNTLDHTLYSDEEEELISGYMATVITAIDGAATVEEINQAVAQFKANVESVTTQKPADNDGESSGCNGSLMIGGVTAGVALAAAVAVLFKKKED